VLYADSFGIGSFTEPASGVPTPLWPDASGVQWADPSAFDQESAIGWQVSFDGVLRVWSTPVPGVAAATRLWVGRTDTCAPTSDEAERLTAVAGRAAGLLRVVRTDAAQAERLRRLDLTAELLPALMPVTDHFSWSREAFASAYGRAGADRRGVGAMAGIAARSAGRASGDRAVPRVVRLRRRSRR